MYFQRHYLLCFCTLKSDIFFQQLKLKKILELSQPTQMVNTVAPSPGGIQIVQQIIGPNGEIQQIPIQLTNQQLQLIRAQMTGLHLTIEHQTISNITLYFNITKLISRH